MVRWIDSQEFLTLDGGGGRGKRSRTGPGSCEERKERGFFFFFFLLFFISILYMLSVLISENVSRSEEKTVPFFVTFGILQ